MRIVLASIAAVVGGCCRVVFTIVAYAGVLAALILALGALMAFVVNSPFQFRVLGAMCLVVLFTTIYSSGYVTSGVAG